MVDPTDRPRYSETQLREIIARAAVEDPLYSSREIRDIGAELGIDAKVMDAAIVSISEREKKSESRALGFVRYSSYGAGLGFIGAAGLLTPGVETFAVITCGAMLAVSSVLTRPVAAPGPRAAAFLRRNFVAWGSFVIGGTLFARLANPEWLGDHSTTAGITVAGLWILSSIAGAALSRMRRRPEDPAAPTGHASQWRVRLAARIKKWVDAVLLPSRRYWSAAWCSLQRRWRGACSSSATHRVRCALHDREATHVDRRLHAALGRA